MKIKLTLGILFTTLLFSACKKQSCPAYGKVKPNIEASKTIG